MSQFPSYHAVLVKFLLSTDGQLSLMHFLSAFCARISP